MTTKYIRKFDAQRVPMRCPLVDCSYVWKCYSQKRWVSCPNCITKSKRDDFLRAWEENPDLSLLEKKYPESPVQKKEEKSYEKKSEVGEKEFKILDLEDLRRYKP